MGSPTFGMPTSGNNAPPPTFGSMTNPTGGNTNMFGGGGSFPSYPIFGSATSSPASSVGPYSGSNLNSLFNNPLSDYYSNTSFWNQVGKAYGPGTGQALETEFGQLFNGNTVAAYLNAMQPGISQGQSNILSSFGAEGSRFGSAAAYGLGQYNSGVQLNEGQLISQMYQNAINQEINITESMMPTLHSERANQGGILGDVLGGLETIGGIAAAPFTGGMSLGLTGMGINSILGANGQSSSGNSMLPFMMGSNMGMGLGNSLPGYGGNTGTFGTGAPSVLANSPYWNMGDQTNIMQVGGGSALGGASNYDPMLGLY